MAKTGYRAVLLAGLLLALAAPHAHALAGSAINGDEGAGVGTENSPVELAPFIGDSGSDTVDWGDNTSDTCQIYFGGAPYPPCYILRQGEFGGIVYGYHHYAEQDDFGYLCGLGLGGPCGDIPYTTTITEYNYLNQQVGQWTGSATVSDGTLTGQPVTTHVLTGVAAPATVLHFLDTDPNAVPGDYVAGIDWGDGSAADNNTTVTGNAGSGFDVTGSHAYAAPGSYQVKVTVIDEPLRTTHSTITVASTVNAASSGVASISTVEGTPFSGLVAQFCASPNPVTSATIDWGDGSPADGSTTIKHSGSCYQISGGHTYGEERATAAKVTVTPGASSGAAAAIGDATVNDAPLTATMDSRTLADKNPFLTGPVLAHIKDANSGAAACNGAGCDLSASINWGDGSARASGTIEPDPAGGYEVTGPGHRYASPGSYTVSVSVTDDGAASARAAGSYTVAPPPAATAKCQAPVPSVGATAGLYGAPLDPITSPNWGISSDDRVLRFGRLVLCAVDKPWVYEGVSPGSAVNGGARDAACVPPQCRRRTLAGGIFQTSGMVSVNGIHLDPVNQSPTPLVVDTGTGSISGPQESVKLTQVVNNGYQQEVGDLGTADLTSAPWILNGDSLAWLLGYNADGFRLVGSVHVRIDGLATSAVDTQALMPQIFSLAPYAGGQPSSPVTFADEYPGAVRPGGARDRTIAPRTPRGAVAHQAGDGCNYPAPTAPIHLEAPDLYLGGIEMHCAYLEYNPDTGDASGGGGFGIGPVYVDGFFDLSGGSFKDAGGGVDGLNVPVFPGVTLQSIHFSAFLDPTRFHASAQLQIGQGLATLDGGALTVFATGDHQYYYNQDKARTGMDDLPGVENLLGGPWLSSFAIGAGGEFQPLGLPIDIKGYALYAFPAYIEFGGGLHIGVLDNVITVDGHVQGQFWLDQHDFDIEGGANVCVKVIGCSGASGLISSRGVIGCWDQSVVVGTISVGGGYRWGDTWPSLYFSGCTDNFGDYRVSHAADAASATGARSFRLPPGLPGVMIRIVGSGDAPGFTISGPHGEHTTTGLEDKLTAAGQFVTLRYQHLGATWVGIKRPAAGLWTFTPLPGSAPITQVAVSDGLPPASVHATVGGRGRDLFLHFSIRARPNQSVRFVERGRRVSRSLGVTSATRGTIRFSPAIGPAGRRQIVALVSIGGIPAKRLVVASYRAPGPPRAATPPKLRLRRRSSGLAISWGAGAYTSGYRVVVLATDGRRLLFSRPAGARRLTVPAFPVSGATVRVYGIGPDGSLGAPASARIADLGHPAPIRGLRVRLSLSGLAISWRRAAGAADYRLAVALSGLKRPILLVSRRTSLTVRLTRKLRRATVIVRGEGVRGAFGLAAKATVSRHP